MRFFEILSLRPQPIFLYCFLNESPYRRAHLQILQRRYYFGLRPWELRDTRFEGDFIVSLNAKHEEDGELVYKKIPIPTQLKARLDTTKNVVCKHRTDVLNRIFKRIMQDEEVTQYFLRHTFANRQQPRIFYLNCCAIFFVFSSANTVPRAINKCPFKCFL